VYFRNLFVVLNLSFPKLKYSCKVKDVEFLKCLILIECFILQHVSCSPHRNSEVNNSQPDKESLYNVPQHIDSDPDEKQQVRSPVTQSDYGLQHVEEVEMREDRKALEFKVSTSFIST